MKTQKDIKLKDGSTLPKGLPVTFIPDKYSRCLVHSPTRSEPYQVRITSAFKAPSVATLTRWGFEGYCKTPTGHKVEEDGHGPDGSPSWTLALGFI